MNQPIKSKVEGEIWKMKPLLSRDFKSYVTGPGPARARLRREPPRIRGMRLSWRNAWSHRPHSVALYILYMHSYIIISHVVYVVWKIGSFTKTRPLSVSCQIFQRIERFSPAPKTPGRDSGGKASMWIMAIAAWWCPDQTLRACFQASHRLSNTFDRVFVMFFLGGSCNSTRVRWRRSGSASLASQSVQLQCLGQMKDLWMATAPDSFHRLKITCIKVWQIDSVLQVARSLHGALIL